MQKRTPAMQQFDRFKRSHPDCVLLFRMGDFYESFEQDALTLHKALGLTLANRTSDTPMVGVPHHQLETYLRRLIDQGFRVAVADQVQDPKDAKGVVERAVTRVVTPGTLVDESLLPDHASATLGAVLIDDDRAHIAAADLSTGRFLLLDCHAESLIDELSRLGVTEILFAESAPGTTPRAIETASVALSIPTTPRASWQFRPDEAREALLELYRVTTLGGFGLDDEDACLRPGGAIVRYLRETQISDHSSALVPRATLAHLSPPTREDPSGLCMIDAVSMRALEVERTIREGALEGSLLGVFLASGSACATPMGKRLLRDWLCRPLAEAGAIRARHAAVATLVEDRRTGKELHQALDGIQDVARIAGRLALDRATPRDIVALARSLGRIGRLTETITNAPAFDDVRTALESLADRLAPLGERIAGACVDDPPAHLREGGLFRDGVDEELDEARMLQRDAGTWLAQYQQKLMSEHDLPNLKVGYNKVFGYYIELTRAQADGAPDAFTRKQTLKNAERYITPELKEFEDKVTTAEARAVEREKDLFKGLCDGAREHLHAISAFGEAVARLDVLSAFATRAVDKGWTRPEITEEATLSVHAGRHPVLADLLGSDFVPNDVEIACDGHPPVALITGPNMAGKSTYIRQVALIVLLAHAGSFVPADRATIGLCDRIFTRVGADDALHRGQSTFMVEMTETANILNNATERSLVILDEIGRGTSTLDGLSLAWAITERLAGVRSGGDAAPVRTLFATHYHELTDLEERLSGRVGNLHVGVREWTNVLGEQEIIFLHRIAPGPTNNSYGLHVARLAGVPGSVIERARQVLESLAVHHGPAETKAVPREPESQLGLFTEFVPHPAVDELREIKLDAMTPLQAFDELRRLAELARDASRER